MSLHSCPPSFGAGRLGCPALTKYSAGPYGFAADLTASSALCQRQPKSDQLTAAGAADPRHPKRIAEAGAGGGHSGRSIDSLSSAADTDLWVTRFATVGTAPQ